MELKAAAVQAVEQTVHLREQAAQAVMATCGLSITRPVHKGGMRNEIL
jgi:hypothetical protein